jgi:hypothetical protein
MVARVKLEPIHWVLIVAGGALLLFGGREVAKVVKRSGKQLGGPEAFPDDEGWVKANPAALANALGASLEVYALARLMRSEAGSLPEVGRIGVAWATLNEARARGVTPSKLLLGSAGLFGSGNAGAGRYAATAQPPTQADLDLAARVWAREIPDPTGGAVQWDSPRTQRALIARNAKRYKTTPEQVAANRIAAGRELVLLPGIDHDVCRWWRPRAKKKELVS